MTLFKTNSIENLVNNSATPTPTLSRSEKIRAEHKKRMEERMAKSMEISVKCNGFRSNELGCKSDKECEWLSIPKRCVRRSFE